MGVDVHIFEVSLRDGLQNERGVLTTAQKVEHFRGLVAAGVRDLEVTSFVRPDRVPALADASELLASLPSTTARSWVLVPNLVGMEKAMASGARGVCTVLSASETHNRRNINRSVRDSLGELRSILSMAADEGIRVRAYISTSFGCPYEGHVGEDQVIDLARRLMDLGAERVVLGDTIGTGLPDKVQSMVDALGEVGLGPERLALHAHDTRGTALVNVYAAWRAGVTHFDASVAGIGGCPYAPGASGNLATEDVVHMFEGMGVGTGVDLARLVDVGRAMAATLGRVLPGRVHQAFSGAAAAEVRSGEVMRCAAGGT